MSGAVLTRMLDKICCRREALIEKKKEVEGLAPCMVVSSSAAHQHREEESMIEGQSGLGDLEGECHK